MEKPSDWKHRKGSIEFNQSFMTQGEGGRDLATYCEELGITEQDLLGKKILDVGAGLKAELAQALGDRAEVVSFSPDYSDEKYMENVANLEKPVVAGVGQAMPFKNESFEVVLMLHVTEHVNNKALEEIIQEIVRILQKDGVAYIAPLLEGDENYKPGQVTIIKKTIKGIGVNVTFENDGKRARFDLRSDASGPHQYVYIDQQRAKLRKER
jgi:ubiquinone/menaquinone biosynthesis C-methylase UbiE